MILLNIFSKIKSFIFIYSLNITKTNAFVRKIRFIKLYLIDKKLNSI
jgi:hypothetical protein